MGIIENAKEIAELVKKYNDQELYQKIVSLREDNLRLKEFVAQLESATKITADLKRDGNAYYIERGPGAFWTILHGYEKKLVNMSVQKNNIQGSNYTTIHCDICAARKAST